MPHFDAVHIYIYIYFFYNDNRKDKRPLSVFTERQLSLFSVMRIGNWSDFSLSYRRKMENKAIPKASRCRDHSGSSVWRGRNHKKTPPQVQGGDSPQNGSKGEKVILPVSKPTETWAPSQGWSQDRELLSSFLLSPLQEDGQGKSKALSHEPQVTTYGW